MHKYALPLFRRIEQDSRQHDEADIRFRMFQCNVIRY
jgi:hypothetical protein